MVSGLRPKVTRGLKHGIQRLWVSRKPAARGFEFLLGTDRGAIAINDSSFPGRPACGVGRRFRFISAPLGHALRDQLVLPAFPTDLPRDT
jgi:hypothetical protein